MKFTTMKSYIMLMLLLILSFPAISMPTQENQTSEVPRISVEEAAAKTNSGVALLVCSYDDTVCDKMLFEGAMLRSQFEKKLPSLNKDQAIYFYCN